MAPIDSLFARLKEYYTSSPREKVAAISPLAAAVLSILYTLTYVLPFYLSKTTRPSPTLHRDAPSVIRARVRVVSISSAVCTLFTVAVLVQYGFANAAECLRLLGWWPISFVDVVRVMLLVSMLFAGPLFEAGIVEGRWKGWLKGESVAEVLGSWIGWRNYVAGPVTEELIFRSLLTPLHLLALFSPVTIIFLPPLYFGLAHLHHLHEYRLTHPHTPLLPAIIRSLFQFGYTSLFGFFAQFVFLRTASLPACILAHSFCNWAGLPRFWGRVGGGGADDDEGLSGANGAAGSANAGSGAGGGVLVAAEAGEPIGPPGVDAAAKRADDAGDSAAGAGSSSARATNVGLGGLTGQSEGLLWSVAYYVILVLGAAGFWLCLRPLTESEHALAFL